MYLFVHMAGFRIKSGMTGLMETLKNNLHYLKSCFTVPGDPQKQEKLTYITMRRLIIIALILIAGWLIFDKGEDIKKTEPADQNTEQAAKEETVAESENGLPLPTPPEMVQKVGEGVVAKTAAKTSLVPKVVQKKLTSSRTTEVQDLSVDAVVRVYLYEWGMDLSASEIPSGNIGFEVVNNGQFSHHFAIRDVQNFGKIVPGEIRTFSARLNSGEFELYSPRNIDVENGMSETLTVGN